MYTIHGAQQSREVKGEGGVVTLHAVTTLDVAEQLPPRFPPTTSDHLRPSAKLSYILFSPDLIPFTHNTIVVPTYSCNTQ